MESLFENTENKEIILQNLWQTIKRRRRTKKEKYIELSFEAKKEELEDIEELAYITGLMISTIELPDDKEFDIFADFLLFCKELKKAQLKEEETAQITIKVTERELKAAEEILSQAKTIFLMDVGITEKNADFVILIESFRRRMIKAAGMTA